jgi:AraC-like DNA-binding protein
MLVSFQNIVQIGLIILPIIFAWAGLIMLFLSYRSSVTNEEAWQKRSLIYYFAAALGMWVGIFLFIFYPNLFYHILPLHVFFILSAPASTFCFLQCLLTGVPTRGLRSLHYLPPFILALATFVVGNLTPVSYRLLNVYTVGTWLLVLFSVSTLLYFWWVVYLLYKRNLELRSTNPKYQSILGRWMMLFGAFTFALLLSFIIPVFVAGSQHLLWACIGALLFSSQLIVLLYNMMREHYSVFVEFNKSRKQHGTPQESTPPHIRPVPIYTGIAIPVAKMELKRKNFEEIFVKGRLYINPNITINDLAEQFGINQPTLSLFIRQTYGMNFRQYINTLRMEEMERLMALPANAGKKPAAFVEQVGFGSLRSYQRFKSQLDEKTDSSKQSEDGKQ